MKHQYISILNNVQIGQLQHILRTFGRLLKLAHFIKGLNHKSKACFQNERKEIISSPRKEACQPLLKKPWVNHFVRYYLVRYVFRIYYFLILLNFHLHNLFRFLNIPLN